MKHCLKLIMLASIGKILIKNKRLKMDVEKYELELFWRGEFSIDENEEPKEDASAAPSQGKNFCFTSNDIGQ